MNNSFNKHINANLIIGNFPYFEKCLKKYFFYFKEGN